MLNLILFWFVFKKFVFWGKFKTHILRRNHDSCCCIWKQNWTYTRPIRTAIALTVNWNTKLKLYVDNLFLKWRHCYMLKLNSLLMQNDWMNNGHNNKSHQSALWFMPRFLLVSSHIYDLLSSSFASFNIFRRLQKYPTKLQRNRKQNWNFSLIACMNFSDKKGEEPKFWCLSGERTNDHNAMLLAQRS